MKTPTFLLFAISLSGCVATATPPGLLKEKQTVVVESELLLPCDELPLLKDGAEVNVLKHYEQITLSYKKCASRKQGITSLMCDTLFNCVTPPSK